MVWNYSCCYLENDTTCHNASYEPPMTPQKAVSLCSGVFRYRGLIGGPVLSATLVLLTVGAVLHGLCMFIFIHGSMRRIPSIKFYMLLSFWNIIALCTNHLSYFIRAFKRDLYDSSLFCAMFGVLFIYPRQLSSWTLALISIEHMYIMKYPFHRRFIDRYRTRAMLAVMAILALAIPLDIIFYINGSNRPHWSSRSCGINVDLKSGKVYEVFRNIFITLTYALIPFVIILLCNIEVLRLLSRKDMLGFSAPTRSYESSLNQRTRMQMLMCAAFLILLMPYYFHWYITLLFEFSPYCRKLSNLYEDVQLCMGSKHPVLVCTERLMRDLNHAVHFFVYLATSQAFRRDLRYYFWELPATLAKHGRRSFQEKRLAKPKAFSVEDTAATYSAGL